MNRLPAIREFLSNKCKHKLLLPIIAQKINELELQINVGQDGGTKVQNQTKAGHKWWGYEGVEPASGRVETWKPFRIPYNSNTENAHYEDRPLSYSTDRWEAIGFTGWNWVNKQSEWIGYDFDSITSHSKGLTDEELQQIRSSIENISWVTAIRSTSGRGLHFYISLEPSISTSSHTEHAALARAILGIISLRVGYPLEQKVDTCGGILWCWHRNQTVDAYTIIHAAESPLKNVPTNWREHVPVIAGRNSRIRSPLSIDSNGNNDSREESALDELIEKTKIAKLDDDHRRLMGWLSSWVHPEKGTKPLWWWDSDRNCVVCHTFDLLQAHRELKLKGPFYTTSTGKDHGKDQNCFGFPLRNGGWVVRRHTRKTAEHPFWSVDSSGWTRCYYNASVDLATAARCHGGVERTDGNFEVPSVEGAIKILRDLGAPEITVDTPWILPRPALIRMHKDGRAILSAQKSGGDIPPIGWSNGKSYWERIVPIITEQPEIEIPDEYVRHLVASAVDAGWFIYTRNTWTYETEANIKKGMIASGYPGKQLQMVLGHCVNNPWHLVNKPFMNEYPGNRTWNKGASQFAYKPQCGPNSGGPQDWPTWQKVLCHCGAGLDEAVLRDEWCKTAGVQTGADYLFLWISTLCQFPNKSLPYLFFFGPQNTGKSIFHEALGLHFKNGIGYIRADVSLTSDSRFNGELANAVLCIVEEIDLSNHTDAYNRIKEWVTSKMISIHCKGETPYELPNTTHWVQCSNNQDACPHFMGDTRITTIPVKSIPEDSIPKDELLRMLEVEAPFFLYDVLRKEIPQCNDRLRIPVVTTAEKLEMMDANIPILEVFFKERVYKKNGHAVGLLELFDAFKDWAGIDRAKFWDFEKFKKNLPDYLVRGRWKNSYYSVANMSLDVNAVEGVLLKREYDRLVEAW